MAGGGRVPQAAGGTLGEAGELGLVSAVTDRLSTGTSVEVGPGDDAAVLRTSDGRVVASTDLLVEDRHFRRAWTTAYDLGRKAAAQNLADIAAMGARPTALLVGLAAPADLPMSWALELVDGLRDEAAEIGASVVGGDTSQGPVVLLAITALGDLDGRQPVRRGGARTGDVVAVCGRLGWAEAGLAVLGRGFRSPRVLVEAHRRPVVPYDAGPEANRLGATSMIDVSDGLVQDLGHVAAASGVTIDLEPEAFEVAQPLVDVAAALGADPLRWVLTGGDDHALAATFPAGVALPERWRVVGRVGSGDGVTVGGALIEPPYGHQHFR